MFTSQMLFLLLNGLILYFYFHLLMAFLLKMSMILQEYIEENNGKSINLAHTTVKIPGKRPPKLTGEFSVLFRLSVHYSEDFLSILE